MIRIVRSFRTIPEVKTMRVLKFKTRLFLCFFSSIWVTVNPTDLPVTEFQNPQIINNRSRYNSSYKSKEKQENWITMTQNHNFTTYPHDNHGQKTKWLKKTDQIINITHPPESETRAGLKYVKQSRKCTYLSGRRQ